MYRRLASPLHATRASAGAAYCLALGAVALTFEHPLILGAVALAVLLAARAAGVWRDLRRVLLLSLSLAILIAVINPLTSRNGLTILVRLGEVPPLGKVDVTLEALAYGVVLGVRVAVVAMTGALLSAAVDPDGLLRAFRRISPRSALTAVLMVRLVPVLARDARRVDDARRCRADGGGTGALARVATLRALATSALERAVDVAATLEVRGYGAGGAGRRGAGEGPWSRHDLGFLAAALGLVALAVGASMAGAGDFAAYPTFDVPLGTGEAVLAASIVVVALLPFSDRRGIG